MIDGEWIMSQRGPLTSQRGFLTGARAAAASDDRHVRQQQAQAAILKQQQQQQQRRPPLGEIDRTRTSNVAVDSADASAARRLKRLELKRAQVR